VFVSFVPKDLIQRITEKEKLNKYSIQTAIKRKRLPLRFGDIREVHNTKSVQGNKRNSNFDLLTFL